MEGKIKTMDKRRDWMVPTSITLPQSEIEKIDKERGSISRTAYLREIILNRKKRQNG